VATNVFILVLHLLFLVVLLQRDGTPIAQGEICRFPARDKVNPFERWLALTEVTCVASTSQFEFPRGMWNVFARSRNAISTEPLLVDRPSALEGLSISLDPAATVVPLLPAGHRGVIYVPRRNVAFPVEERTTVPAQEELWLFVLEKGKLVAVVPVAPLTAGTERSVDARSGGPSAVIGWLQVPDSDRIFIANTSGLLSPGLRSISGVVTRHSDLLSPLPLLHGSFFRIRDVPAGDAELRVEGRGWVLDRRSVKVDSSISTLTQPLTVRAGGTLIVHWSTTDDLRALDRSLGACNAVDNWPLVEIEVAKCPPRRPGTADDEECAPIRVEQFEAEPRFGSVTLEDLIPGRYRVEMRFGKLPPVDARTEVVALQQREVRLQASYFVLNGSITHGGEPLGEDVKIKFPAGYGFAAGESEEYHAVLRDGGGPDLQIAVTACDGSPRTIVLTDEPIEPGRRFDIDIPANELTVRVMDTFTQEALRGATVKYDVMTLPTMRPRSVMNGTLTTGGDGDVVMRAVPAREIRLTVSHAGYQKQEVEPFTMPKSGEKTVDVYLMPLRGNRGKIQSTRPFESGVVVWFSPGGIETERADLAADGTFVYTNWHIPEETMAVVSLSHPLWVLHSPAIDRRETITIRFPDAPVRSFGVSIATSNQRNSWHVGVAIGGVRVPQPALAIHQALRRELTVMRAGKSLQFRDLLATGPIDVILGPTVEELSFRVLQMDFFALEQYANAPRLRIAPDATTVTFLQE